MNRLYLLRHGIAVPPGTPGIEDDDRPLTRKGKRRMRQIARGLLQLNVQLDRIISSPVPRALCTAQIVAGMLGMKDELETDNALHPGQPADSILDWLKHRDEERFMIVGHDPAFSDLVGLLARGGPGRTVTALRKGGIAAFRDEPGEGMKLDWLARPRILRSLAR